MRHKTSQETKDKIEALYYLKGLKKIEISQKLKIPYSTVCYWLVDEKGRKEKIRYSIEYFRKLPLQKKKEIYSSRRPYIKKYLYEKYHNDEVFRRKCIDRAREYNLLHGRKRTSKHNTPMEDVKGG